MLLLIDNFDSFTHNLARYFVELGQAVNVVRNNAVTLKQIESMAPRFLVISPGPCTPNEAGISLAAIKHFSGRIPILGVCLGHQAIGQALGGNVINARSVRHGKISPVFHEGKGLMQGIGSPFNATRYHSLVLDRASLPAGFRVDAWCNENDGYQEIMAISHRQLPLYGVQFHPESLLTDHGHALLNNFLVAADKWYEAR